MSSDYEKNGIPYPAKPLIKYNGWIKPDFSQNCIITWFPQSSMLMRVREAQ